MFLVKTTKNINRKGIIIQFTCVTYVVPFLGNRDVLITKRTTNYRARNVTYTSYVRQVVPNYTYYPLSTICYLPVGTAVKSATRIKIFLFLYMIHTTFKKKLISLKKSSGVTNIPRQVMHPTCVDLHIVKSTFPGEA